MLYCMSTLNDNRIAGFPTGRLVVSDFLTGSRHLVTTLCRRR
uniref:Uncharacterized protein n=1 Tax=Arundo donax TaxID=35708 RepID=A0A0A9DZT1_ARUDO